MYGDPTVSPHRGASGRDRPEESMMKADLGKRGRLIKAAGIQTE